jgi:hypothetical protein
MSNLFVKGKIPDGSKMSVSIVDGAGTAPGSFVASARLVVDDGAEETWEDADIHPGPKNSKKLKSPKNYVWRIFVGFASPAPTTAVINAQVLKPDGTPFGAGFSHEVTGQNGDEARATLVAMTLLK